MLKGLWQIWSLPQEKSGRFGEYATPVQGTHCRNANPPNCMSLDGGNLHAQRENMQGLEKAPGQDSAVLLKTKWGKVGRRRSASPMTSFSCWGISSFQLPMSGLLKSTLMRRYRGESKLVLNVKTDPSFVTYSYSASKLSTSFTHGNNPVPTSGETNYLEADICPLTKTRTDTEPFSCDGNSKQQNSSWGTQPNTDSLGIDGIGQEAQRCHLSIKHNKEMTS